MLKLAILAALCTLPLGGALWLSRTGWPWAALAYGALSLLAFVLYWQDKRSARRERWRIPERVLHGAELLGGWPGALIAQQAFRHKTRKVPYQAVFWGIVALHQGGWVVWLLDGPLKGASLP